MDNKLLNKAITISAKEEKLQGGKPVIKLKDEKGLTYTVYKIKQDGSTSIAWDQLQELGVGDTVQIGYVEEIVDNPQYGKTTYRTIRNFNKDIGEGVRRYQNSPQAERPRGEASGASSGQSDDYWEKKAYKQCLWGYALQVGLKDFGSEDLTLVWNTFKSIEMDAERRFAKGWAKAEAIFNEDLPTIQVEGDVAGEFNATVKDSPPDMPDIPF